MRLNNFWRRKRRPLVDPTETAEHLERAQLVEKRADEINTKERQVLRENHLGYKARMALGEAHR